MPKKNIHFDPPKLPKVYTELITRVCPRIDFIILPQSFTSLDLEKKLLTFFDANNLVTPSGQGCLFSQKSI